MQHWLSVGRAVTEQCRGRASCSSGPIGRVACSPESGSSPYTSYMTASAASSGPYSSDIHNVDTTSWWELWGLSTDYLDDGGRQGGRERNGAENSLIEHFIHFTGTGTALAEVLFSLIIYSLHAYTSAAQPDSRKPTKCYHGENQLLNKPPVSKQGCVETVFYSECLFIKRSEVS